MCEAKWMSPETSFMQVSLRWKATTSRMPMSSATKANITFSIIILRRRLPTDAPITRRVLMPRMRIGISESEKLSRLSMAIKSTKTEATVRTPTKLRLPRSFGPTPEKYMSSTGVMRIFMLTSLSNFFSSFSLTPLAFIKASFVARSTFLGLAPSSSSI